MQTCEKKLESIREIATSHVKSDIEALDKIRDIANIALSPNPLSLKEKFIKELDKNMKNLLEQDAQLCKRLYDRGLDKNTRTLFMNDLYAERNAYEILMRFANTVIGKREVQKLCDKYNVRNRYT